MKSKNYVHHHSAIWWNNPFTAEILLVFDAFMLGMYYYG